MLDYQRIFMFGVNATAKFGEDYDDKQFMDDFKIDDPDYAALGNVENQEIGCINSGGNCDGDWMVGVCISRENTRRNDGYEAYGYHDLLEYESKFYDVLEKYGMTKKYGKGEFMLFNYIW